MRLTRPPDFRRSLRGLALAAALASPILAPGLARGHAARDPGLGSPDLIRQVKAAFLFNFMRFVDWPADTSRIPEGPWQVAVLGDSSLAHALSHVVEKKIVKDRPFRVRWVRRLEDVYPCHALFVGPAADTNVRAAVAAASGHAILTVGEQGPFARSGGIIWFFVDEDRVRFAINVDAARRAGLKVSSKLLSLAVVYRDSDLGALR